MAALTPGPALMAPLVDNTGGHIFKQRAEVHAVEVDKSPLNMYTDSPVGPTRTLPCGVMWLEIVGLAAEAGGAKAPKPTKAEAARAVAQRAVPACAKARRNGVFAVEHVWP
ncbi:MAG: hypothetical protein M1435_01490 [Actinobacteria bacterium]|nr:hypothetical protein [Actinomycetota bacterium]